LPDDVAGRLIKHIYSYVNDENPQTDDVLLKVAFASIKTALKRDLQKYLNTCEKNKENADKRWNKNNANACERMPTDAKHADSDNDNGSDTVNVKDKEKVIKKYKDEIINFTAILSSYFDKDSVAKLSPMAKVVWIDTVDKLIRVDKYSKEEIERVVKHTRTDAFWAKNFLTLNKLRKKNKDDVTYFEVFKANLKKVKVNNDSKYF
jgi:hypothetical protein